MRTMVDALEPGLVYIQKQTKEKGQIDLKQLSKIIRKSADDMQFLYAKWGKNKFLGVKAECLPDPSCELMALIFKVISEN